MGDENDNQHDDAEQPTGRDLRTQFESQLGHKDREILALKAGIDTDNPLGAMFVQGYTGEPTKEAMKAAFDEALSGLVPAAPPAEPATEPPPATGPTAQERTAHVDATELASQSLPPGPESKPHPGQAGVDAYWQAIRTGSPVESAEALGLDTILHAAMVDADPRVLLVDGRKGGD
jgi:hypothetical protein